VCRVSTDFIVTVAYDEKVAIRDDDGFGVVRFLANLAKGRTDLLKIMHPLEVGHCRRQVNALNDLLSNSHF
jgi:hypothetical protein